MIPNKCLQYKCITNYNNNKYILNNSKMLIKRKLSI